MGRGRRDAEGSLPRSVDPPAIIGEDAIADLIELLDHIASQSPATARKVAGRIISEVERVARSPRIRPVDADAPDIPAGLTARKVTVSGFTIRFVHPLVVRGRARVLIVSIQRGVRMLDKPEYVLRLLEERARRSE